MRFFSIFQCGDARVGRIETAHGELETPVFMPVGTYGTVKATDPDQLWSLGFRLVLANSLHLVLAPGVQVVEGAGGIQSFMGWQGAVLTDSGGFQVFSLEGFRKVSDEGVVFRSPTDGAKLSLSPEEAVANQVRLGVDVAMVLDECPPADAPRQVVEAAVRRTSLWARRSLAVPRPKDVALFGIVQGGTHRDLRRAHLEELAALDFDGLALGGFSVGEPPEVMHELVSDLAPAMPADRPRYLMGVGRPVDILVAVRAGVDMFDCVIPTRHARNGQLLTSRGRVNVANAWCRTEFGPPDPECSCPTCRRFSLAYLSHLYRRKEILYSILATVHNLAFYARLMETIRKAIAAGRLGALQVESDGWVVR